MIEANSVFKCLSDETRLLATLLIQKEGELCVGELVEAIKDSQPKISRHLGQLRRSGILIDRKQGQWVYYSINKNLPEWVINILKSANDGYEEQLNNALESLSRHSNKSIKTATA